MKPELQRRFLMQVVEKSAKTVEEAIKLALTELNRNLEEVENRRSKRR